MRILTLAILSTLFFNFCSEDEEPFPAKAIVYPNPFLDRFNLYLNVPENAHVEIRIAGTDIKREFESGKRTQSNTGGLNTTTWGYNL